MRLTETLITTAALVAFVACAAALALELSHTDERVDTLVAIRDWSFLSDEAASGNLPSTPILIRNSPAQRWLKTLDGDIWTKAGVLSSAEAEAGDYNVKLLSSAAQTFINHNVDRYDSYGFAPGRVGQVPTHDRSVPTLRSALQTLWPADDGTCDGATCGWKKALRWWCTESATRRQWTPGCFAVPMRMRHYLSAVMSDFAPQLASPLQAFLPDGCLRDDRFMDSAEWTGVDLSQTSTCRDLSTNMWLGSEGVSTRAHYDMSHNLFLQTAGSKRFTLLPPAAHRRLKLYPYWHGSNRQTQRDSPAHTLAAQQDAEADAASATAQRLREAAQKAAAAAAAAGAPGGAAAAAAALRAAEAAQDVADYEHHATVVTVHAGELLFVPAMYFHAVESLERTVSINWWSGGVARDVWVSLELLHKMAETCPTSGGDAAAAAAEAEGTAAADDAVGVWAEPLACVRAQMAALLAALEQQRRLEEEGRQPGGAAVDGVQLLAARARRLLEGRYDTPSLPLLGSRHSPRPPPATAGSADGVRAVERACRKLRVGQWVPRGNATALSPLSRQRAEVGARNLLLLDEARRELELDEMLDHAAALAVSAALADGVGDGAAVQSYLQGCWARAGL